MCDEKKTPAIAGTMPSNPDFFFFVDAVAEHPVAFLQARLVHPLLVLGDSSCGKQQAGQADLLLGLREILEESER